MNGGVCLVVDVDRARLDRRCDLRYLDRVVGSRDEALREVDRLGAPARPSPSDTREMQPKSFLCSTISVFVPTR